MPKITVLYIASIVTSIKLEIDEIMTNCDKVRSVARVVHL